jgi:aminopeptidase N
MLSPVHLLLALAVQTGTVSHDATVTLDVSTGTVAIDDTLQVSSRGLGMTIELHAGLTPTVTGARIVARSVDGDVETLSLQRDGEGVPVRVQAKGPIVHAPVQAAAEHQRSFQETIGTIDARGVYLSPQSRFLPVVLDEERGSPQLVNGSIGVKGLPAGWRFKSEGRLDDKSQRFLQETPVEGFHVVAGPLWEKVRRTQGTDVKIWLRTGPDGKPPADAVAVADRYLEVTGQYLALYNDLIGAYPYSEFVLVENFWETGYGMPSFTLLGPQVVRFPFILHTSWPHELLHNWWGNGVFPDGGNWTEGLTAYLADHLTDERQGRGADHRRNTIQRYLDFVDTDASQDFPLVDFRGRFSAASEAVGYGKMLMTFHMLRRQLGDEVFRAGLKQLWKSKRFSRATIDDVAAAFSTAAGRDVGPFMTAWTTRTGIPALHLDEVREQLREGGLHRTAGVAISQTQAGAPWPMKVPVVITTVDGRSVSTTVEFPAGDGTPRMARVNVPVPAAVARVDVDPFFDVFRRLSPDEVPPSLSRALGAKRMLFVTPTLAGTAEIAAWRDFAKSLCPDEARCTIVDDKAVQTLPADAAVWILGYSSYLRGGPYVFSRGYDVRFDDRGFFGPGGWERVMAAKDRKAAYDVERVATDKTALAIVVEHPRNRALAMAFVGSPSTDMIGKLTRKLPHYGKYGAVGFTGAAADNSLKLQWSQTTSPLTRILQGSPVLAIKEPQALAQLPPPFDGAAMKATVVELADPKGFPGGRAGAGSAVARALIKQRLLAAGVPNVVDVCVKTDPGLCNVVARLPGTKPGLPRVVVGAHYDHFATEKGQRFPGADDNASGVAVLIEVAAQLARAPGARAVDVVFFDGEEHGLKGSRFYAETLGGDAVMAMVNLDTVGRKGERPLLILDGDSASEWVHVVRGVTFTTGVQATLAPQGGGASDQQTFLERGVPAIQVFSGPTSDYHKVGDTADKVEPASLVAAAVVAREIVGYLRDREEPLTAKGAQAPSPSAGTVRRASLGSVPDMTFPGPGVRFEDVVAGSPAALAGLRTGDVLVGFGGQPVTDLRSYSEILKTKAPGDTVEVVVRRGERDVRVQVVLGAR